MSTSRKLKILCLHGYRQDSKSFRGKMGSFLKSVKSIADLVFIDSPHVIPTQNFDASETVPPGMNSVAGHTWWFTSENNFSSKTKCSVVEGFHESVSFISKVFENQGPFDGILGFSQGAALAALICGLKEHLEFLHNFQFVILISGFKSLAGCHKYIYDRKMTIPSLHIIGRNDDCISAELSTELAESFQDPTIIYHDGGHFMPSHSHVRSEYLKFLRMMMNLS